MQNRYSHCSQLMWLRIFFLLFYQQFSLLVRLGQIKLAWNCSSSWLRNNSLSKHANNVVKCALALMPWKFDSPVICCSDRSHHKSPKIGSLTMIGAAFVSFISDLTNLLVSIEAGCHHQQLTNVDNIFPSQARFILENSILYLECGYSL